MIVRSAHCWAVGVQEDLGLGGLAAAPMISTTTNDTPSASSGVANRQRSRLISPLSAHGQIATAPTRIRSVRGQLLRRGRKDCAARFPWPAPAGPLEHRPVA